MIDPLNIFVGFISGLVIGILVQYARFRYSSKIEKMKRLSPYLESAYPIVEKLNQDSRYASDIQLQDDEAHLTMVLKKVVISLEAYTDWFTKFREDGMVPELESLNRDLSNRFVGLFTYARLYRQHGLEYISQRMQRLANYCTICKQQLKNQLYT